MHLSLWIDDQLVDRVRIDPDRRKDQQYLDALTWLLYRKHCEWLARHEQPPCFYLEIPSRMNEKGWKAG